MRRIGRLRKRSVAVETRRDRVAAGDAHHQPRARPGVAEIEPLRGLDEAADAGAADPPAPRRVARHGGAERPAGGGGAQHVVAFEKALDPGLADRKQPEDERPMRDRLVAGGAQTASQRSAGGGCGRHGIGMRVGHGVLPSIAGVPAGSAARSLAWAPGIVIPGRPDPPNGPSSKVEKQGCVTI